MRSAERSGLGCGPALLAASLASTPWFALGLALTGLTGIGAATYLVVRNHRVAVEALRESERQLATLLANLPGMAYRCQNSVDWPMVFVSEGCHALTGLAPASLMSNSPAYGELVIASDRTLVWETVQQAVERKAPFELTYQIRTATGQTRWVWERGRGVFGEDGKLRFLEGFINDVTEQKQAERRARLEAERTEWLLQLHQRAPQLGDRELYDHTLEKAVQLTGSKIGFFHQVAGDQQTILFTTWNEEARKSCAVPHETHYPLREAGHWADCVRTRRPAVCNDFSPSPNQRGLPPGHPPLQRVMSVPVMEEGKVSIIFGVGNKTEPYTDDDVAQLQLVANEMHKLLLQRSAQNQLRQSEARLRSLVESAPNGIFVQVDGRFVYANQTAARMFGADSGVSLIGQPVLDRFPSSVRAMVRERMRILKEELRPVPTAEETCLRLDGTAFVADISAAPFDFDGRIGAIVFLQDITDRKHLEVQLRQSQKLEAVGQLAGGVAHDFNNILASMMMHLGLLQLNPRLDPETLHELTELETEAGRAAALTRQLLMFGRRSVLDVETLQINDSVDNLLRMLSRLIGEHIQLRFEGGEELPCVEADPGMLDQVLMNLVVNSRDAMPRGGTILIRTSLETLNAEDVVDLVDRRLGRFICLSVQDTGCGMDAATLKRVFEPFFTTKEVGKGSGLGLATVHGIVAQHKGWVEAESTPGQGSTFRIYLPAVTAAPPEAAAPPPDEPARIGVESVLVVEDDAPVRKLSVRSLKAFGYRVYEAANGQEAIKVWQAHGQEVDVLLTDMVMPEGMTGLELAERLREQKPGLKVIIASGYSEEIVGAGLPTKAGVVYLPKPYHGKTLAWVVRECLDRGK